MFPKSFSFSFLLLCFLCFSINLSGQECSFNLTQLAYLNNNPTYNSYEIPANFVLEQGDSLSVTARCEDYVSVQEHTISRTLAETRNYFLFRVQNKLSNTSEFVIEIENSHNNLVGLYSQISNKWERTYLSGDHINYSQRNYAHRSIVFPISIRENEIRDFIVMIDMVNSSYALPLRVWEKEAFHQTDYKKNLVFGVYLGFVVLVMIFVIFAYLFLQRKILFFYYLVYVLSTALFVLSDLGLGDQFIWPNSFYLDEPITFLAIFGSTSFFLLFATELLEIKALSSKLIYLRNIYLGLVCIEIILLFSPFLHHPSVFVFFFDFALYLIFSGMVLALCFCFVALYHKRPMAVYFLLAFSAYIFGSALKPLSLKEVIPFNFSAQYGVLIGHSFEVIILSLLLVYQAWSTVVEKQILSKKLLEKDKESYQLLAKGEYGERKRLAAIIHDGISPKLAFITMKLSSKSTDKILQLEGKEVDELIDEIKEVSSDLRNLSRSISPIEIKDKGLRNALQDLVEKYSKSSGKRIELSYSERLESNSELLKIKEEAIFFTVNELLLNIITHNNPSIIRVDLKMNAPEYILTVRDDGFAIPPVVKTAGIGMKNIKSRAAVHDGSFLQKRVGSFNEQVFTISAL